MTDLLVKTGNPLVSQVPAPLPYAAPPQAAQAAAVQTVATTAPTMVGLNGTPTANVPLFKTG